MIALLICMRNTMVTRGFDGRRRFGGQRTAVSNDLRLSAGNLRAVIVFLILLVIANIAQLVHWQVFKHEELAVGADAVHKTEVVTEAKRGTIFASDGTVLAIDEPAWELTFELSSIEQERSEFFAGKDGFVAQASEILNIDPADLDKYFTDDFRYYRYPRKLSETKRKALLAIDAFHDEKGHSISPAFVLRFSPSQRRVYPNNRLASHVLGFISRDDKGRDIGAYGVQGFFYGDIKADTSVDTIEVDAGGSAILTTHLDRTKAREGKDIVLTIQPHIQALVESKLKEQVEKYQAKSGSVILMDPQTGKIIAMANYPDYNPGQYWLVGESWILKNKAVADLYEPGSVFKPLTVGIGLQTRSIPRDYICDDDKGYYAFYEGTTDEHLIYTWDRNPDGVQRLEDILKNSNNPCIAQISQEIGIKKYYPYFGKLGIGEFSDIGLQDEATSYVKPESEWLDLDLAVAAFGQSQSVTPLQMVSAFSSLANTHGDRMQPYIIDSIKDDTEEIRTRPAVKEHIFDPDIAYQVQDMLEYAVSKGDAKWIMKTDVLPYYSVAGKTGTAQIPLGNGKVGYYKDRNNTTFIGFSPTHNAQMIMLLRLEEPGVGKFSTENVVPAWVEIFKEIATELNLPRRNGIPAKYK